MRATVAEGGRHAQVSRLSYDTNDKLEVPLHFISWYHPRQSCRAKGKGGSCITASVRGSGERRPTPFIIDSGIAPEYALTRICHDTAKATPKHLHALGVLPPSAVILRTRNRQFITYHPSPPFVKNAKPLATTTSQTIDPPSSREIAFTKYSSVDVINSQPCNHRSRSPNAQRSTFNKHQARHELLGYRGSKTIRLRR